MTLTLLVLLLSGCPKTDTPVESLPGDTPSEQGDAPSSGDVPGDDATTTTDSGSTSVDASGGDDTSPVPPAETSGTSGGEPSDTSGAGAACNGTCLPLDTLTLALQALEGQYVAAPTDRVEITADAGLNVRDQPNTSADCKVLGLLDKGAQVDVVGLSLDGQWYLVRYGEAVGWIYGGWTTPASGTSATPVPAPDPAPDTVATPVEGLPLTGSQTPVRNGADTTWWVSNNSPYHTATGGYRGMNDTQARDYSASNAAGQPVYSVGEGGVVVANVACTYKAFTCANCAEQNRLVLVRYDNPLYGQEGQPRYYYAEYMHIQSDVEPGDVLSATEPFGTIQTEGPKAANSDPVMDPHLHFSLFTSDSADVFTSWSVSDLAPVDLDLVPSVPAPPNTSPQASVWSSTLNVRSGPGTEGTTVLDTLYQGAVVDVTGRSADGQWYQVDHGGQVAWVFAEYVSANEKARSTPVVP